eukprot:scaffold167835_cov48-Prasinocladus_malaysianus.AAC.1
MSLAYLLDPLVLLSDEAWTTRRQHRREGPLTLTLVAAEAASGERIGAVRWVAIRSRLSVIHTE